MTRHSTTRYLLHSCLRPIFQLIRSLSDLQTQRNVEIGLLKHRLREMESAMMDIRERDVLQQEQVGYTWLCRFNSLGLVLILNVHDCIQIKKRIKAV